MIECKDESFHKDEAGRVMIVLCFMWMGCKGLTYVGSSGLGSEKDVDWNRLVNHVYSVRRRFLIIVWLL